MFLKLTQNNATAIWNFGINEHIIGNSVKNSVFSNLCNISLITFTKVLKLMRWYFWTIWNCLESFLRLEKIPLNVPRKIPCFPDYVICERETT